MAALPLEGLWRARRLRWAHRQFDVSRYVNQVLVPTLRSGDVVVLDDLAVHKEPEVRPAIEAVVAHLAFCRPIVPTSTRSSSRSPD